MKSLIDDLTKEAINVIYKQCSKKQNKQRLSYIINSVTSIALKSLEPYLYTIISLLIVLFLMDCFHFYYYIKAIMANNSNVKIDDIITAV
jgi:hypothetical protein